MKLKRIIFSLVLIVLFIGFFLNVLLPSYASYSASCLNKQVGDFVTIGETDIQTQEIVILEGLNPKLQKKVIKHELVHVAQISNNRLYSCDTPLRILSEIEAYTMEDLPDSIFYWFY